MKPRQIEQFLAILARELGIPARAYVTGAAAAAFWGRVRPSLDIDFGLELQKGRAAEWERVEAAVERTSRLTGIPANVAADIDRWGMITLLNYRRTSRLHKRFGRLEVRLLHPLNWSVGKLTRFLDPDVGDVREVFKRQRIDAAAAARFWGRALRASPPSSAQFQFRRNVERFFEVEGRAIWGRSWVAEPAIAQFRRAGRVR